MDLYVRTNEKRGYGLYLEAYESGDVELKAVDDDGNHWSVLLLTPVGVQLASLLPKDFPVKLGKKSAVYINPGTY